MSAYQQESIEKSPMTDDVGKCFDPAGKEVPCDKVEQPRKLATNDKPEKQSSTAIG